jgi:hypothetical protein
MENRKIPRHRRTIHRLGLIVAGIGVLLFLSTFVSAVMNFGEFNDFRGRAKSMGARAVGGMVLIMVGMGMAAVGATGAAGAGLNLDPEQARKDLEPWARLQGGLTKDALDEMGIDLPQIAAGLGGGASQAETLEERLRGLHALHQDGILSDEEYRREKRELLDEE